MSILSTNKKLISLGGTEYSAGQGIDITNHIISVVESAVGTNYSAGPNIDIYDDEGQPTISSKDWSIEIADASANAYEQAISQIPEPQDLSYLSGRVDANTSGIDYISSVCITAHQDWTDTINGASSYSYEQSTSYFDNWISGQYNGDITNITNNITALSGDLDDVYKKTETSSKDEINDALQYVSANAGKVYEGVSPIVVNNTEDKISADTWVFSAGSNVSFVDDNVNKITRIDCSVTGDNAPYSAGDNIDIQDHIISGKDWSNDIENASANAYNVTTAWVQDNYANSADMTYISAMVDTKLDTSAWSSVSGDLATESYVIMADNINYSQATAYVEHQNYANKDFVLFYIGSATYGKLDSSSFASLSGDFLTTAFGISESGAWNEATNCVENNSAAWLDNQGDIEVNELVYAQSANWNEISSKLDSTAFDTWQQGQYTNDIAGLNNLIGTKLDASSFEETSGTFYPTSNPSGFITGVDLSNYYTKDETSGKEELAIAFANIPVGDPEVNAYVTSNSASIDESTNLVQSNSSTWNNVTAYQSNSANYITAHQSLEGLMSAGLLESADGKWTAYNNIPFKAGGEVPEDVMVETNLEYNAVGEISGYGNSAIAQYGAEKQWLTHDDTIVHVANSAQYALGVNLSAVAQLLGVDETVLWSGSKNTTAGSEALSESYMNFNKIDIYLTFDTASNPSRARSITRYYVGNHTTAQPLYVYATATNIAGNTLTAETLYISGSPVGTGFSLLGGTRRVNSTVTTGITSYNCRLVEIRGIGRKEV